MKKVHSKVTVQWKNVVIYNSYMTAKTNKKNQTVTYIKLMSARCNGSNIWNKPLNV